MEKKHGCISNIKPWHCKWLKRAYDFLCDKYISKKKRRRKKILADETRTCAYYVQIKAANERVCAALVQLRARETGSLCARRCNAKQCTVAVNGQAGTLWMEGNHVTAAPPEADISHWLSTSAHKRRGGGSAPLKQNTEKCDLKWPRRARK